MKGNREFWFTLEDLWHWLCFVYGDSSSYNDVWNCTIPPIVVLSPYIIDEYKINKYSGYKEKSGKYYNYNEKIEFDETIEDLWNRIYSKYLTHYIFYTEHPELNEDDCDKIGKWLNKFNNILIDTQDKYRELLNGYTNVKNHLLDGLKSSASVVSETEGTSRFNDTPNGRFVDGNYEGDDYINSINLDTGKNDTTENREWDALTPIQKLDEIDRLYRSAMSSWVKEFDKLFIEEANIE